MVTNDESHGAAADGAGNSRDEASTSGAWWDRPIYSGKVRDLFEAPGGELVMVTTDRLSAFDVVMAEAVPNKGRVLTAMTDFWMEQLAPVVGSHLMSTDASSLGDVPESWIGRTMICRRAEMLPIECIVRGYITGSAWAEYRTSGTVNGEPQPAGMIEADRFREPIFTPSTKADEGHDMNISRAEAAQIVGAELVERLEFVAVELYRRAAARAESVGILLADTKFEFGLIDGELVLCDEAVTPDSSRLWPADQWSPGATPPSFDKQPVRDYLASLDWDRTPPPPAIPADVIAQTAERYQQVYELISGGRLADWPGA